MTDMIEPPENPLLGSKMLRCIHVPRRKSMITDVWQVATRGRGVLLGWIKFESRWQQYVFRALDGVQLNAALLGEMSEAVENLNRQHVQDRDALREQVRKGLKGNDNHQEEEDNA